MSAAIGPIRAGRSVLPMLPLRRERGLGRDDDLRQARESLARAPIALVGQLLSWAVLSWVFRDIAPDGPWWFAAASSLPLWWVRWALLRGQLGAGHAAAGQVLRWHRQDRALVIMQGAVLGLACAGHHAQADGMQQTLLLMAAFCACLAALPVLAHRPLRLWLHAAATLGPMAVALAADADNPHQLPLIGTLVLLLASSMWVGMTIRAHIRSVAHLRRGMAELRQDLLQRTSRAEAGRALAEARHRARTVELAGVGHDMRQPMLALRLQAERAGWQLARNGHGVLADSLAQGVHAVERMVDNLFDLARCEADVLQPQPRRFRLQEVYDRLAAQLTPLAFDRGLDLRWRGGQRQLAVDPLVLERLLRNLVVNALEHTEQGGVLVAARTGASGLRMQVWDSGAGLPSGWERRLFREPLNSPYEPVSAGLHESGPAAQEGPFGGGVTPLRLGGFGLGLPIVRRLAHLMGAEVQARSRPGRGTIFEIRWLEAQDG